MSRFRIAAFLASLSCALFFTFGQPARADELQDISKLYKQGQNDKALERLESYLASRPKDAQGRFLKGLLLAGQGKNAEAIQIFTWLTEEYPELPEPYNNLAVLYASQGQLDKARQALEMAISTHPGYATAHENLGDIYARMASQAYDKALQLDKGNVTAQTKLTLLKELFSATDGVNRAPAKGIAPAAPAAEAQPRPAPAAR
jgi:tetratricopeptide (TPR) repeat protein